MCYFSSKLNILRDFLVPNVRSFFNVSLDAVPELQSVIWNQAAETSVRLCTFCDCNWFPIFLDGAPTSICYLFCPSVSIHPSWFHWVPYLRNCTSSYHKFWYTRVNWWYLMWYFAFSFFFPFWFFRLLRVKRKTKIKNQK